LQCVSRDKSFHIQSFFDRHCEGATFQKVSISKLIWYFTLLFLSHTGKTFDKPSKKADEYGKGLIIYCSVKLNFTVYVDEINSTYPGISLVSTTYNISSNVLLSMLTPYVD
jgi:hypothetical protein